MEFKKAVRSNIWVKVLMIAPSGGGKTYSCLRMATGFAKRLSQITGQEERVAFIDTESGRGLYYADEFDYDYLELKAPFTPERYIQAIDAAIEAGYKVLIIDSLTHEWSGKGGCLEIHSKIPGNSFTAWSKVTPRHEAFMDKVVDSPIHIFATVRGEDKYVLEEVDGKQVPRKVSVGYDQRKQTEYLFTVSFVIEQDTHIATAVKDNTHLFEDKNDILTETHGARLCDWANSGDTKKKLQELTAEKEKAKAQIKMREEEEAKEIAEQLEKQRKENMTTLESYINMIDVVAKDKAKTNREAVIQAISKHHSSANYNSITDIEVAKKVLEELQNI